MKKIITFISALAMSLSCVPMYANADTAITVENNPDLWAKFLKYDLCITDFDSLNNEEKDLCRFIFETEQNSIDTIRCEKARHTISGETENRIDIPEILNIISKDTINLYELKNTFTPDILHLDDMVNCSEYWLNDSGSDKIIVFNKSLPETCRIDLTLSYVDYDFINSLSEYNIKYIDIDRDNTYITKYYDLNYKSENIITYENNDYYLIDDNLYFIKYYNNESGVCAIPEKINGYSVIGIADSAFESSSVKEVSLPDTIQYIGKNAFSHTESLNKINFPEKLLCIDERAFSYTSLLHIDIDCPDLVISDYAFECSKVIDAKINAKVIGENAFNLCVNLNTLKTCKDLIEIKSGAFRECSRLAEIELSENIKYIGAEAFYCKYNKSEIKNIIIPESVEIIGTIPKSNGSFDGTGIGAPAVNSLTEEYKGVFSDDTTILGYYGTEAHNYALANNMKFSSLDDILYGDANNDGNINIADAVSLNRHVLGQSETSWGADLNRDGRIDSFDMIPMRKIITS